uniref:PiggyBac transposable element-derived protein domain-containing protein n=1 Tax=Clastoptera arizonana TaxID=38151 RepID=A0A1B6D3M0_9HEMI
MKNQCAFIQYLPKNKHAHYGIKKFEVFDSKTNYIMYIELYSGNDYLKGDPPPFTEKVIIPKMEKSNLLAKYYHVFLDQFYTKVPLSKKRLDRKTYMTGTVNKNSKYLCKSVTSAKLEAKESIYFRREETLLVGFRQKATRKPVYILTTACHAEDKLIKSKKGLESIKPIVIDKYNQYMGGVDVSDKSIYHTSCSRMTSKYWKKLFFNFIDIYLFSANVLYVANTNKPLARKDSLVAIVDSLATPEPQPAVGPVGDCGDQHQITHLPRQLLRFCEVCSAKGIQKKSRY